ncbi:hypothetical protein [Methanoregula sp.]|uniref:hypothetical protein n=1 Tax=Methanoregula sp. TaxID=2052170 RepID=UPI0035687ED2
MELREIPVFRPSLIFPLFFETSVGKIDLHNRVPVAFSGLGWGKIGGKTRHGLRAFGGGYTRCDSAVFWQTERNLRIFSTGTKKEDNPGFYGSGPEVETGKGARIGLILKGY